MIRPGSFPALEVCRGQRLAPSQALAFLLANGYRRFPKVNDPGDCALRGGILDIFPEGFEAPVRLEFDHETVASIRSIHPETGAPFDKHEMVIVLPTAPLKRHTLKRPAWYRAAGAGEEDPIDPFVDIQAGDGVVHVTHGIGRYLGLKKVGVKSQVVEHIVLEYADNARLYVPLSEIHLVQKYAGFEGRPPKLSRLGTRYWARTKEIARQGAHSVAFELLAAEARRLSSGGHAFGPDTDWQKALEKAFPYRETPAQSRAVHETKEDMESSRAMDRLLCGDVGYGKTEVALRAAFKACLDGKQAALLCPTTILAEQHHDTFKRRMKDFPVEVAMLSRFQSPAAQTETLKGLRQGTVDVVIGTHRLFSGDVRFKDLGLVVVDEEQRFGVRHKEKLKRLTEGVDVLTLTATPIPRTLYLALMGARAMSVIDTPPYQRLPVKTVVTDENDAVIRQALARELGRGGQAFVIYPWVEGIAAVCARVKRLAPQARVAVAHGQMPSRSLEKTMLSFMRREVDILVSTSIVESGIDIPNANTIVVFRAESFGLADLYQLRGRVGRFTRQATAYFLKPRGMPLSADAQKRLSAVQEFSSLGAGFKIALRDLQIRGAGNLLGVEQHGHIVAVGFDLYCRLLKAEVETLKAGVIHSTP
ncbi:MAG: DEAD/DEAH box helicase [Candidatus Omnitrophica bacterium]|nr:DEAD/DEAH box helicase [Candidatus Omnitrophota bacterium]